ncbi:hypothetical protein EDC04DRAFT_2665567, partial [Pisolithus marmoratus]
PWTDSRVMTVPFLRNGLGCQHMKIFYETGRLRVVMSTANLINYDWRDVENAVWLQDIPPHDFPSIMQHVLRAENVRDALTIMLTHEVSSQPPSAINRRPMLEMGLVKG